MKLTDSMLSTLYGGQPARGVLRVVHEEAKEHPGGYRKFRVTTYELIIGYVCKHPGSLSSEIALGLHRRSYEICATLHKLVSIKKLRRTGGYHAFRYWLVK